MMTNAPVKRRRHLMDPNNPVRPRNDAALTNTQRWVASTLAVTTVLHLVFGLVLFAIVLPEGETAAKVALNVISGAFGVIAVGCWLLIHGKSLATWWLALGLVVVPFGLWFTF